MSKDFPPPSYEQLQKDIFGIDKIGIDSEERKQMIDLTQHYQSQREKTLKQNEINKRNPIDLTSNNDKDQHLLESKQSDDAKHADAEVNKYIQHLNIVETQYMKLQQNLSKLISLVLYPYLYKI